MAVGDAVVLNRLGWPVCPGLLVLSLACYVSSTLALPLGLLVFGCVMFVRMRFVRAARLPRPALRVRRCAVLACCFWCVPVRRNRVSPRFSCFC